MYIYWLININLMIQLLKIYICKVAIINNFGLVHQLIICGPKVYH
jgi:hypothetical protein